MSESERESGVRRSKRLRQGAQEETQTNQDGTPSPRDEESRRSSKHPNSLHSSIDTPPIPASTQTQGSMFTDPVTPESMATDIESEPVSSDPTSAPASTDPGLSQLGVFESGQTQGTMFTGPDTPGSMATDIESEPVSLDPTSAPPADEAAVSPGLTLPPADEATALPESVSPEVETTEGALQGEFLLQLIDKDEAPPEDEKTVKKGGIPRKDIVNNETFIQHYLHCPYDTKSGGLKGGNYMDKISEKFGLKKVKSDIKIDRPDFSQPAKTSHECKKAKMVVDKEELIYEDGPRAKPMRPGGTPTPCYMTGFYINLGSGTEADGYHCEHYLIIGDIGNSLRLALDEYEKILKKMVDGTKFEEFQGLSKSLWSEVYKPSQPPSNLLKAEYIFVNLNHRDLNVSVNYHNIIRMMTTLVFGYRNNNSHSINFREKFLDDIHGEASTDADKLKKEEAYLHSRIQILFKQAEDFCKLWKSILAQNKDIMLKNASASVLTTIRYLHMKKKEQLGKISGKNPSSTAMKSITSFLNEKVCENSEKFLKKRLAKALSVFDNFENAAKKILDATKYTIPMGAAMRGGSTRDLKPPTKLERHETTGDTIPLKGTSIDRGILEKLRKGEMANNYHDLSEGEKGVKTLLLKEAVELTRLEYQGLYNINDAEFELKDLSRIITDLIEEGNNPPPRFDERNYGAHRALLKELYDSNEELLKEIIDDISSESIYLEKPSIDFLMSEEMIEYNSLLESACAILLEMDEPDPEMEISEMRTPKMETPKKGQKKKTKKKLKKSRKKGKSTKKSRRKKKRKTTRKKEKKQGDLIDKIIDRLGY